MNIVILICARSGSKGVPNKNIKELSGKPLIAWTIEIAKKIKRVDRIIVSTDSEEIADIAKSYGAEVPFLRPIHLAQDDSPEWLVWRHAINFLEKQEGSYPDAILVLPVTSPLRSEEDVNNCIDLFQKEKSDVVITITDASRNPYFNMVKIKEDMSCERVIPSKKNLFRRQDAPKVYDMTTVAFLADSNFVLKKERIFDGDVRSVLIPTERSLDIDNEVDFQFAEFMMSRLNRES